MVTGGVIVFVMPEKLGAGTPTGLLRSGSIRARRTTDARSGTCPP
ncbi:hypothetical protein Vau01_038580 [Virgisporangium aurantiacum]|uniref:Uncharacterized protein n=1 Tax=Virgisporangium aurantiacum TaxID=175570 RepID=A0A8J3Z412_9ACTN|nr:hypothetical protein Vau01_038580 [Virgisporangium aurantiacum]